MIIQNRDPNKIASAYLYDYIFVADNHHEITLGDVKSLIDIVCSMLRKEIRTEGLWLWPGWRRPAERLLCQWVGFQNGD